MKASFITLLGLLALSAHLYAQCNFFEDYSANSAWTQMGSDVEIVNGQLEFQNGSPNGNGQKRVYASLGTTLDAGDTWMAELAFTPNSVGSYLGDPFVGHCLVALTAGTQEPFNACPDLPCTGLPNGTQDGIILMFGASNPTDGNTWMKIKVRDNSTEYTSSSQININTLNVTLYPRLERTSPTKVELSVFSDPGRTNHLAGSPVSLTIPNTVEALNTVQQGSMARGDSRRQLTGSIDDLCITYTNGEVGVKEDRTLKQFAMYPNPSAGHFQLTIAGLKGLAIVEVYDLMGNLVHAETMLHASQSLNISSQIKGVYWVRVVADGTTTTQRMVKL